MEEDLGMTSRLVIVNGIDLGNESHVNNEGDLT